MSTRSKTLPTPEEYLAIEREAEPRSEYRQGEMFRMEQATGSHTMVVDNPICQLLPALRGTPCRVYSRSMRVLASAAGLYCYPLWRAAASANSWTALTIPC